MSSELTSVTDLGVSKRDRLRPKAPSDGSLGKIERSSGTPVTVRSSSSATSSSDSASAYAKLEKSKMKKAHIEKALEPTLLLYLKITIRNPPNFFPILP